jgi:hypothetical protein
MIIAPGNPEGFRGARGYERKMFSSFFPSGLVRWRRAKPEGKKEVGWGGFLPRAAASAALPWATIRLPLRGAGKANQTLEATAASLPVCGGAGTFVAPGLRRRSVSGG